MPEKTHHFTAPLDRLPDGLKAYYVPFPGSVEEEFGSRGSVRVLVSFNGVPAKRALIPRGDGTHYLLVNPELRRRARLALGSPVRVELTRDLTPPDELDLPDELTAALDLEPGAMETFQRLKIGVRRGMALWVDQAKRPETRVKRALDLLGRIQSGEFMFGGERVKV
jgi:hypothetical protein